MIKSLPMRAIRLVFNWIVLAVMFPIYWLLNLAGSFHYAVRVYLSVVYTPWKTPSVKRDLIDSFISKVVDGARWINIVYNWEYLSVNARSQFVTGTEWVFATY